MALPASRRVRRRHDAGRRSVAAEMIQIRLLGAFEFRDTDGRAVEIEGRKGRALLAYLACPPGRQRTREQVCALLWTDRGEDQARGSLRQLLSALRKCNRDVDRAFATSRDTVALDPSLVDTDVAVLERNLSIGTAASTATALRLYRGAFLEDLDLSEGGYEAWVEIERRRFHEMARRAARSLLDHGEAAGDHGLLREAADRLITLEPGDEIGHCALMRLHAAEGDLPAALRQYKLRHPRARARGRTLARNQGSHLGDPRRCIQEVCAQCRRAGNRPDPRSPSI